MIHIYRLYKDRERKVRTKYGKYRKRKKKVYIEIIYLTLRPEIGIGSGDSTFGLRFLFLLVGGLVRDLHVAETLLGRPLKQDIW